MYATGTRYYDPEVGRFVNADDTELLGANSEFISYNLFAYCGNNPVIRVDVTGYTWETIFDVLSLGASIAEVVMNPADPWAWAGVVGDAVDLIPFVTGVGEVTRAVKVTKKNDNAADAVKTANRVDTFEDTAKVSKKIHSNSLKSTKINYGYALVDENNNIMKFGETKNPSRRYTKKYLKQNGYTMKILEVGSKADVHYWQYDMNMYYLNKYKMFPPLNKRGW